MFQFYYIFHLSIAQPDFEFHVCADTEFSPNTSYDTNLNTTLSSVSRNMDSFEFYNTSIALNSDTISVIAQCRGDVQLQACRDCISNVTRKILEVCPYKKSAFGYYESCQLRYSNEPIIGTVSISPQDTLYSGVNASNPDDFMKDVTTMLESLRVKLHGAVSGSMLLIVLGALVLRLYMYLYSALRIYQLKVASIV